MPGRHRGACKPGCEGCAEKGCWCHVSKRLYRYSDLLSTKPSDIGLKAAVLRLRKALDAAKAYMATVKADIEATAAELEGMIGGNEPE